MGKPRYDPAVYREVRQPTQVEEAEEIEDAIAALIDVIQQLGPTSIRVRQRILAARPQPWDGHERRCTTRAAPPMRGDGISPKKLASDESEAA